MPKLKESIVQCENAPTLEALLFCLDYVLCTMVDYKPMKEKLLEILCLIEKPMLNIVMELGKLAKQSIETKGEKFDLIEANQMMLK